MLLVISFFLFTIFYLLFTGDKAYAAACSSIPAGGDYTVSSSCNFSGTVDGVDNGNLTINNGTTLTINAGQTVVWNSGKSITVNGSIIINSTGQLKKTNLWMTDADSDNYPASTTQVAQDNAPANGRRRNLMSSVSSTDCNDSDSTLQPTRTYYTDADADGYGASAGSECQTISTWGNSACTTAGSAYAKNSASTCRLISVSGTDCDDTRNNVWLTYNGVALDADQDGYIASGSEQWCVGNSTTVSGRTYYMDYTGIYRGLVYGQQLGSSDCLDSDGTKYQNLTGYAFSSCAFGASQQVCSGSSLPSGYSARNYLYAFSTSTTYTGNLGGVTGADSKCQARANAAGLGGTYTAWISQSATTEPRDRGLSACASAGAGSAEWRETDGTTVTVNNWADLTDGSIDNSINRNENGSADCGSTYVWTCTTSGGILHQYCSETPIWDCTNWSSAVSSNQGMTGQCTSATYWTDLGELTCDPTLHLYCFQSGI